MKEINTDLLQKLDAEIKKTFPNGLVTKRDTHPGIGKLPYTLWSIAPTPMHNLEIGLAKYKNHLLINKYIVSAKETTKATIYSGGIPVIEGKEILEHDLDFICKLLSNYQCLALEC